MTISDRFTLFLREKGISQKEFSEKTGYLRQSLSKFITGTTKLPKIDLIIGLMIHYPELNIRWLLLGEGEMRVSHEILPSTDEIEKLKQMNVELREELLDAKDEIIQLLRDKK